MATNRFQLQLLSFFFVALSAFAQAQDEKKGSILITGANRGLGLELVKQFIGDNYLVYGTARNPESATELKATGATVLQLDVTSQESIEEMAAALEGQPIDILFNNAGYFGPNKIGEKMDGIDSITREEIEACFAVNTMGPIFVTQALMPNLRAGKSKKVINMSTRSSMISKSRGGAWGYRVSKAALNMVTSTLNGEIGKEGFIVASVAPGHNITDMGTERAKMAPEESMPKLKAVIEKLTKKQSGGFWYYTGERLAW